jgi:hypothetical protein
LPSNILTHREVETYELSQGMFSVLVAQIFTRRPT